LVLPVRSLPGRAAVTIPSACRRAHVETTLLTTQRADHRFTYPNRRGPPAEIPSVLRDAKDLAAQLDKNYCRADRA
jgi:hypothetical protein